jgi:hypothetical protein
MRVPDFLNSSVRHRGEKVRFSEIMLVEFVRRRAGLWWYNTNAISSALYFNAYVVQ